MISEIIFGLLGMAMAIVFYLVPIVKLVPILGLKSIPLGIVILIGVGMMIYNFFETVRDSRKK